MIYSHESFDRPDGSVATIHRAFQSLPSGIVTSGDQLVIAHTQIGSVDPSRGETVTESGLIIPASEFARDFQHPKERQVVTCATLSEFEATLPGFILKIAKRMGQTAAIMCMVNAAPDFEADDARNAFIDIMRQFSATPHSPLPTQSNSLKTGLYM